MVSLESDVMYYVLKKSKIIYKNYTMKNLKLPGLLSWILRN